MNSPTFIKMCVALKPLQEAWEPKEGDWVYYPGTTIIEVLSEEHVEYVDKSHDIYLPSLEDMFEMVRAKYPECRNSGIMAGLYYYVEDRDFDRRSLQELALQWIAHELYNLKWQEGEWVDE